MQKKFFSNLILIVFLNLLVKPFAIFGVDAQVQNVVGETEYGFYFSLLNFTYLFNILLDFGITNFNTKYIAQYPHLAKQYIGKLLPLRFVLFLIYVCFTFVLAFGLNYNQAQFNILYILIFNQFLVSILLYFRSYFSGLLLLRTDILLSVLDKLFLIFLAGYFLYFSKEKITIQSFVYLQSITLLLSLIIAFVLLIRKIGIPKIKWDKPFNIYILKQSFPYALLIVLMMLYSRIDSVMLERMLPNGQYQAGIYAQGFRLLDAFVMFAALFSTLLFPLFSSLLKNKELMKPLLFSSFNILIPGAIVVAFCAFFDAPFLLGLFYKNDIHVSSEIFQILMLSFIPLCITLILGTLLTSNGNMKFLNLISLIGIGVNVILNFIFIPKYGALATAYTSLITQSVVALFQFIHVVNRFEIKANFQTIMKYLALIALLFLLVFLKNQYKLDIHLSILIATVGTFYIFFSRLFDWKMMRELFKEKTNP